MNRINPIYVIIFLVGLLVVLFFKLNGIKNEFSEVKQSYKESLDLATQLSQLKKVYRQKLRLPYSISSKVTQKKIKNGVAISSKNMDIKTLNSLMGKILNGAYKITDLNIKRVSDTEADFYMEIKW
jgi:hypothetical protein